jgi:putative glutamine amidotransferase
MKPIIGITTFNEVKPKKTYNLVSNNYVASVQKAGGVPVLIPITSSREDIEAYAEILDGIIFSGGEDVSPMNYNENPLSQVTMISEERDCHELRLFEEVYKRSVPILGICRGIQLINVALGGTLYQDIPSQISGSLGHLPIETPVHNLYHTVKIEKNTKLFEIFEEETLKVNSFHHQAVRKLGQDLKVTALSKDGIIEAVEGLSERFLVAVQWHPEDLTAHHPEFLKLFNALVDSAKIFSKNSK